MCRQCFSEYEKERWRDGDNIRKGNNNRNRIERNREYVAKYLIANPCECGESDIRVLEFDHADPSIKYNNICDMVQRNGIEKLKSEISKCNVLCANCHRRKTSEQFGWWRHQHSS